MTLIFSSYAQNTFALFRAISLVDTLLSYGISSEQMVGAVADENLELGGFSITPIPSAHEELHQDENGNSICLLQGRDISFINKK